MESEESPLRIFNLPEDVLSEILLFLDGTALFQLSKTSSFFRDFVNDFRFWRKIDARNGPNSNEKVGFCSKKINEKTEMCLFKAESKSKKIGLLPMQRFLATINWIENLRILSLENQLFSANDVTMNSFPKNLEELSLKNCVVKNSRNFFRFTKDNMLGLRVLILDNCQWVESSFLMSVSKYPKLEILSVVKCQKLDLNNIAEFSLATYGLKSLKIFDCRFTVIAPLTVQAFKNHTTTLAYYFQQAQSYPWDYDTKNKRKKNKHTYREEFSCLSDIILSEFVNLKSFEQVLEMPNSRLYVDPYGPCECDKRHDSFVENEVKDYGFNFSHLIPKCRKCMREKDKKKGKEGNSSKSGDITSDEESNCLRHELEHNNNQIMIILSNREGGRPEGEVGDAAQRCAYFPLGQLLQGRAGLHWERENSHEDDPENTGSINVTIDVVNPEKATTTTSFQVKKINTNNLSRAALGESARHGRKRRRNSEETASGSGNKRVKGNDEKPVANDVQDNEPELRRVAVPLYNFNNNLDVLPLDRCAEKKISLRRLSLRGYTKITDKSLGYIKNLKLDLLDLTYTSVTKEGIETFLQYNPNCRIIHKSFCVCKPKLFE